MHISRTDLSNSRGISGNSGLASFGKRNLPILAILRREDYSPLNSASRPSLVYSSSGAASPRPASKGEERVKRRPVSTSNVLRIIPALFTWNKKEKDGRISYIFRKSEVVHACCLDLW